VSKRADSGYTRARSHDWLRLKQTFTADMPIVDTVRKDGALKAVIVRGPEGVGPIKLGRGWSMEEAVRLNMAFHSPEYLAGEATRQNVIDQMERVGRRTSTGDTTVKPQLARISYQLSTGDKRTVRGAVFHNLV
jgi:ATP-dependent DNA ligase